MTVKISFEDGFKVALQPANPARFTEALRCILPFEDPLTIDPIWLRSFEALIASEAEVNKVALAGLVALVKEHGIATVHTGGGKVRRVS